MRRKRKALFVTQIAAEGDIQSAPTQKTKSLLCKSCEKRKSGKNSPLCHLCISKLTRSLLRAIIIPVNAKCEICGSRESLVRDHDHKKVWFRGILCRDCNTGLGLFSDSPERLEQAAAYLREFTKIGAWYDRASSSTSVGRT